MTTINKKRQFWQYPWSYREGFLIAIALVIAGFAIGYVIDKEVKAITFPENLVTGGVIILLLLITHLFFRKHEFVKWIASVPAAISAISAYAFLVLLMGFIRQNPEESSEFLNRTGLSHLTSSQAFLFAQMYFLVTLGMVTLKRIIPFKTKNIGFMLNHLGLWITIAAASLGAGDIQRVSMEINDREPVFVGTDQQGNMLDDMGLAIQLIDFKMESYPPKAFIVDRESGDILNLKNVFSLEMGARGNILGWEVEVVDFIEFGVGVGDKFHKVYDVGAAPAAYVTAKKDDKKLEGWISCGSFRFPGNFLDLGGNELLVMDRPAPKSFVSEVKIYTEDEEVFETEIAVNSPVTVNGWKIYQYDYNHDMGDWSDISVIELIKDPWLPVVYTGIFMLMAGAFYMFWTGNRKKTE
ncbi:MAG: hypothetical protein A2W91_12390 [Bacteroidetes bacterium GWF2_38_335]|nr:MAG: hypothetical protein A2W91_12390 [Bacteroidetes bacterium GWF2_38_335]OFY76967.1 MAG: hypothetical protein A2281_00505 [Bacteroidetes bacterium RIFOXYA12_FULL_38_20]HBS86822.1 hypothetical protein [Bacteroidales bacterium]